MYANAVLADNPAAYFRFEETTFGRVVDLSSNVYAAAFLGGVDLKQPGALANESSFSIRLNGTTGWVRVGEPGVPILQAKDRAPLTIELWAKPELVDSTYAGLVTNERPAPGRGGWLLWNQTTDGLGFERWSLDASTVIQKTPAAPNGQWTHVVLTFNGNTSILYFNGQEYARLETSNSVDAPSTAVLAIGARAAGTVDYFKGWIDEVAIYETALDPERIGIHYSIGAGK